MDKMKMETRDLTQENVEKIAKMFPNTVTEARDEQGNLVRKIDFEKLKQELSAEVIDGDESYDFTWVGKKAAMVEANKPTGKTLRPCPEESVNWDTTENLYIEGDNLEVLKLLQESYLNKVKMIYIDPPYNTGNDSFIYPDDYATEKQLYDEEIGAVDDSGYRMFKNTEANGRFHSSWCSMMYPRLKLARNLLSEDGVIFISIDDNEVDNLKKICDEVFGSANFVGMYIKQSKIGGGSDSKFIVKEHEYCIVFSKNINRTNEMFIAHDADYLKRYKETDNKGKYFWDTFARPGLKHPIIYDIIAPDGTIIRNGWIHSRDRFEKEYASGDVQIVKKNGEGWSVQFKQYLNENGKKPRSMTMDFGGSIEGKNDVSLLFENEKIFNYPKSVKYLSTLINTLQDKDSLILDFFSGSATTAHAVMQLNAEDGGKRKFIMVQLPEVCDEKSEAYKAGYKNICEIGKERIRRAGKKIVEETGKTDLDTGFRVLKLDESNMKDVYYTPDELSQKDLVENISNIKDGRSGYDLLYQCILDWGLELSLPHRVEEINGNEVHIVNDDDLIACFDENISEDTIKKIADRKPTRVVFRDSSFASSAARINVEEIFKLKSPNTKVKVL